MIYIDENTTKLDIPKLDIESPTNIQIKDILRNSEVDILIEESESSKYYYKIDIEDWEFKFINGSQYEFYLKHDDKVLSSGIIQCGEYTENSNIQYITEDKNYKQYNR